MADNSFDVIVIGSGPGGYVAAIRGAQLGLKVACVEADKLGGVCNNIGCIPTKAMLESAKYAKKASSLKDFGVNVGEVTLDIAIAAKRAQNVASAGNKGVGFLFKKNKITSIDGWARLAGNGKVEVEKDGKKTSYSAKHIVLATGSRPPSLPMLKIDGDRVWSSDQAVFAPEAPKRIAIIGAGAIGMEFADVFAAFGSEVTIVEALDQVLPLEDKDSAQVVERSYKKRGMKIHTSARVEKADVGKKSVKLTFKDKGGKDQTIEVDRVLVAVGRAPIVDDIGLEKAGVKTDRGFIQVNDRLETTAKGVYAIGDCARPPLLAHKASHEGIVLMEHIAGQGHGWVDYNNIPNVTYCHPEVASVGLTEEDAREKGFDIEQAFLPYEPQARYHIVAPGGAEAGGFFNSAGRTGAVRRRIVAAQCDAVRHVRCLATQWAIMSRCQSTSRPPKRSKRCAWPAVWRPKCCRWSPHT